MKYENEQQIIHSHYKFTLYSRPYENSEYTGSGQTIVCFCGCFHSVQSNHY